ncbi:MAG TPA: OmpA family protein [Acetobacteraceae bacterium]|nr:OmpA family protein [Acetobacteraceae bacterium]
MRHFLLSLAILLCLAEPALAQVTVDLHALDALPRAPEPPARRPVPKSAPAPHAAIAAAKPTAPAPHAIVAASRPTAPAPRPAVAAAQPSTPPPSSAVPSPPLATLPASPPPVASIAPIQPPAAPANAPPPAPPPIAAGAATTASATPAGLRLTFAGGQSDLSAGSADSIKRLVRAAPAGDATTFNVLAYASGDPDDPSVARRRSLARAIAVRDALIADGVPSSRIYLRALGSQPGKGPPDRVDLGVLGANASQQ